MSITDRTEGRIIASGPELDVAPSRSRIARLWDQTSVRQNLSSNLVTKGLSALVSLACVPIYLRVLGVSGYGLIGVWGMLETLANLLDLGLSPTMTRQMAAASGSPEAMREARDLVRTLEVIYWLVGFILGGAIIAAAPLLATHWLNSNQFSAHDLRNILVLIGFLILCRWPLSFYSGGITGLERQVLLSWVSFVFLCARSFGAVLVLLWWSPTIAAFFWWQVAINALNTAVLVALLWKCLPGVRAPRFRLDTLRSIRRFAVGITGVAIVSMLLTDLDKIVVSKMLPLEQFGYYSLAWRMASILYMASGPVFAALFPALSRIVAARDHTRLVEAYHIGAQLMSVLILPPAITMIFFARQIIFAWTGSAVTAEHTWRLASILTAGTAFNCIVTIPFALQMAHGWTSLAFRTNLASTVVTIPLLLVLTKRYGGIGAASVWLLINVSYLVTQVQLMHRRLLKNERSTWYVRDVLLPTLTCSAVALVVSKAFSPNASRFELSLAVITSAAILYVVGALTTPLIRQQIKQFVL